MPVTIEGPEGLQAKVGEEVGVSGWRQITQDEVNAFAETTGDDQWIHVDVERAKKESPFGGPIVHGYFTLSLHPVLMYEAIEVTGFAMAVNYGLNKVRFVSPLPVGDKVRMRVAVAAVEEIKGGVQTTWNLTWEREGGEKPVCVAESISRNYLG
jgi:acyl dehydratase